MQTDVALVVGGSGMLSELVVNLVDHYKVVGVVGRDRGRLKLLAGRSRKIAPIRSDYTDTPSFETAISAFAKKYGNPTLVVAWVHSTAPNIPVLIANYCEGDFYEITSSSGKEHSHHSRTNESKIKERGVKYHRVILGHMGNRWLTNSEISEGVYMAIQAEKDEYTVGES